MFSAVRETNYELVKLLVDEPYNASVDLNGGELVKDDPGEMNYEEDQQQYESFEEKNFMEAYKNCMTPLHLACIIGSDEIVLYLINKGSANPNLQTNIKGYSCLHLAVLANKPEMIIELLTQTKANPLVPDYSGRTFLDIVELYIPSYLETFTSCNNHNFIYPYF